jgi:hypothetical protein
MVAPSAVDLCLFLESFVELLALLGRASSASSEQLCAPNIECYLRMVYNDQRIAVLACLLVGPPTTAPFQDVFF